MVSALRAFTLFIGVALLAYAMLLAGPILVRGASLFWRWWATLAAPDSSFAALLGPLAPAAAIVWNPWGAAVALLSVAAVLFAAARYLPSYISGE